MASLGNARFRPGLDVASHSELEESSLSVTRGAHIPDWSQEIAQLN